MIRWRSATVTAIGRRWRGSCELTVSVTARDAGEADRVTALAYTGLVGQPQIGDRVLLNCNALAKNLGTGGYALVVAVPDRLPPDVDSPGHIVKARYTPLQAMTLAVDEDDSPHRQALEALDDIDGMPVVAADLHSALPAILAGIHATRPDAKVAYVMTDGGALPAWFSRNLDALSDRLAGTITTGQCFGGDFEATNIHNALLSCRMVTGADIAVVSQGPGNLGTGTIWGFSGTSAGEVINATATLDGRAIGALRVSEADARERHQGISHHSLTAYGRVALAPADIPVPDRLPDRYRDKITEQLELLAQRHRIVTVDTAGLDDALRAAPVKLSTMGRGLSADHAYFLACAAAGRHAAALLS